VFNVTALPTFVFFRGGSVLETFKGADPNRLEETIERLVNQSGGAGAASGSDSVVPGQWVLNNYINAAQIDCLNNISDSDPYSVIVNDEKLLQSDCDEQLILSFGFNVPVKVHSLRLLAPSDGRAPMTVKIFANTTAALDFDQAERLESVQTVTFTPEHVAGEGKALELRYVKFQNVLNLTFFIKDNQGGEDSTVLRYLEIIGSPRDATDMKDFKRVAGKEGESDH